MTQHPQPPGRSDIISELWKAHDECTSAPDCPMCRAIEAVSKQIDNFALAIGYAEDGREFGHDGVMRLELPELAEMIRRDRETHFAEIDRSLSLLAEREELAVMLGRVATFATTNAKTGPVHDAWLKLVADYRALLTRVRAHDGGNDGA